MGNAVQMAYQALSRMVNLNNTQQVNASVTTVRTLAMESDINKWASDALSQRAQTVKDAATNLSKDPKNPALIAASQNAQTDYQSFQAVAQPVQQTARSGTETATNQAAQYSSFNVPLLKMVETVNSMAQELTRTLGAQL
jgi:predicted transcriptional regulator